ncbi:type II toxin-antitoxin system PemK/MazF family toxin [Phenylobacterium sp.]|uniref:type II toxin-antitoxin system PemK/MazF family toxin n=1 Tax=Phenylobacterium sp. TaxID=1871053 RepID=UPI0025F0E594|nr:type II toxin-antitoxin system PemK/MazF family toxin [Phenylobacterium sp.]
MTFEPFDVVVLPFPYSDRLAEKRRPALVVSAAGMGASLERLWVAMITTDRDRRLFGDASIGDPDAAGLPAASIIRASKIATIELTHVVRRAGRLATADQDAARLALKACAGF